MNFIKKSIYALSLVGMAGLWSCSQDGMLPGDGDVTVKGKPVKLTLTVNRAGAQTRTTLTEDGTGRLVSDWADGDILYVYDTNANKVGALKLESGKETPVGVFSGTIIAEEGTRQYNFWYFNLKDDQVFFKSDGQADRITVNVSEQDFKSAGDLAAMEILSSHNPNEYPGEVMVTIKGDHATVDKDVLLQSRLAMAHFSLTGLPGEAGTLEIYDVNNKIYIEDSYHLGDTERGRGLQNEDGSGIKVNMTAGQTDVYVALIPNYRSVYAEYTLGFKFTSSESDKVYAYQFTNSTPVEAGVYYCGEDGQGQVIEMEEVIPETPEEPVVEDDGTVGPTIEINGKYYRFMRGNLYCDILDKDNYTWHLYDRETDYQLKAGTSSYYDNGKGYISYVRQINGTWKGSSNPTNVSATNHYIDMFAWGATGLGTGDYKAKLPDIIRKGVANENTGTSYTGAYWPSDKTDTMDPKANASILDLWQKYSFDDPVYDFGYAYMQTGAKTIGDARHFVTAPLEAYAFICNPERSFSQGCVVKGANYDGTSDAKGALILYGITDIEDAKAAIAEVGGSVKTGFAKLTPNKPKSGFTYLIELPNYDSLRKLDNVKEVNGKTVNIQALFFASGGNGVYNFTKGTVDLNATDGAYWTSDGSKGSSSTANAYAFYFRNTSSATEFCWETDASGVSSKRNTQRSVRLMVEVPEPDGLVGD